ncbi:hypothetical protein BH23BAC2_BH23BAC2_11450 [soil metagenome]
MTGTENLLKSRRDAEFIAASNQIAITIMYDPETCSG